MERILRMRSRERKTLKPIGLLLVLATIAPLDAQTGGSPLGGFGGPAVLGRGVGSGTGQRGGADLGIGFFAGVMGTIDSGLTGLRLDPGGSLASNAGKGVDGFAGLFGSKRLKRGSFGINYTGHYRQYSGGQLISGTDQSLGVYTTRQLSKRGTLQINANGMTTNRPFGFSLSGINTDPSAFTLFSPSGELFDNRIYSVTGGTEYSIQKSARLSFSFGGQGFLVRRTGGILFGVNGATATASAAYRLSRRQTVSAGYQFLTFNFTRNFGDSYGQGAFAGYSVQLNSRAQLALQGGFYRLESLGLRTASVDPIIAKLIGVSSVQEVFHSISILPTAQLSFQYKVARLHSVNFGGGIMASPGNGVINTSRITTGGASYTYSGIRSVGLSASAFYNRMSSLIASNQSFDSMQISGNASKSLAENFYLTMTAGNRRFLSINTSNFARNSYFATLGITWSPNEVPISIR